MSPHLRLLLVGLPWVLAACVSTGPTSKSASVTHVPLPAP